MKKASNFALWSCSLLALLPQVCIADMKNKCTKFTPSSDIEKQLFPGTPAHETLPTRQVSSVLHCKAGKPLSYYDCLDYSRGCTFNRKLHGGITTTGNSNVTADVTQIQHLAELVTENLPKKYQEVVALFGTTEGCFEPTSHLQAESFSIAPGICIPEGKTGYAKFAPSLYCAEGTLSGCSGQGPLHDNQAVRVCGVEIYEGPSGMQTTNQIPRGIFHTVQVDASEAHRFKDNPSLDKAGQATCHAVKIKENVAVPGVAAPGASALAAFLASVALAVFF